MKKPHGIIVFGANGSGKTTLARELARVLSYKHMDIEDYCFEETAIPYAKARPREDYINLMLNDIEKHRSFVLSTVIGDLGDAIAQFYELAVYMSAPHELRMERIKQRSFSQFGNRVLKGGDMVERELRFYEFVATRPLEKIERWAHTLTCPVIHIDGTLDWRVNAAFIADQFHILNK
ncbi:MAG: AAA family ATPase [Oscillospiraceae bacterium]|jgi:cytidylate kinase|nr:AAA family ATPase [Oscillospiraceae bacterium]